MRFASWRRVCLLGLASLLTAAPCLAAARTTRPPAIQAPSAILLDAETGAVLFAKNANKRRPMASTTKIMTAILILEYGHLDETVMVSQRAAQAGQSSVWLQPGEQLTLDDLLKGILVRSGNDAAVAAAEHIAGSEQNFVQKMNARARALGAKNTHFVNPHGLHHPNHYSTAADLALMARRAMRIPAFRAIVRCKTAVIANPNQDWDRFLRNHNELLEMMPEADGIKTGYVRESGYCLVFSATRKDWRLIGALLGSSTSARRFEEAAALLRYGFANFRRVRFARTGQRLGDAPVKWGARRVPLVAAQNLSVVVLPRGGTTEYRSETVLNPLRAPIRRGEQVGRLELLRGDERIEFVALTAGADVPRMWWVTALRWLLRAGAVLLVGAVAIRTAFKTSRRRRRS